MYASGTKHNGGPLVESHELKYRNLNGSVSEERPGLEETGGKHFRRLRTNNGNQAAILKSTVYEKKKTSKVS
jgi:hypothetical protein